MVVYLARESKMELAREPEHDQEGSAKLLKRFRINLTDDLPDAVASQRHHFVCHDLRAQTKTVALLRFDDRTQRQLVLYVRGDRTNEDRRKRVHEFVGLHDDAGSWPA